MKLKRIFDVFCSILLLSITWPLIGLGFLLATFESRSNGFFLQERVGKDQRLFKIIKIKTMWSSSDEASFVTVAGDPRVIGCGVWLRKWKIDELPQLLNVLLGDMSLVGPRPEVRQYILMLEPEDRKFLKMRPGITGPASIKYIREERLLSKQSDPEEYYRTVVWPDKVRLNLQYVQNWSFSGDLNYLGATLRCLLQHDW